MNPKQPAVLILGAAGRFGQAAVQAFTSAGWRVLAQARRPAPLPVGAVHIGVALDQTETLATLTAGARVVIHAVNPPYTRWEQEALPLARLGMDLAQRLGATFMLPGNVYNFGASMPALLDENSPQRPSTSKGRIRCAIESEMQARTAQGLRSVVLRAGDFFGSGTGSWLDLVVVKSLGKGRLVYPGPLDLPHAWAYLPDLVRAFVALAEGADRGGSMSPEPLATPGRHGTFSRWHFAGYTLTGAEFLGAVGRAAAALGIPAPAGGFKRGGMPWGVIRAGGLFVPAWRAIAEMSYLWRVPHALDGRALARAVGALPATPIDTALQTALFDLGIGSMPRAAQALV